MDFQIKERYDIDDLCRVMKCLRAEDGCPWDKVQTHKSIRKDFIEEVYEVIEAIDTEDSELMREELGDVLLQVVFHAQMEEELGNFTFNDVANDVTSKLVIRHPHVFGEVKADTEAEVLKNWDAIKKETKKQETYTDTIESVCKSLPALMRAQKIGKRMNRSGIDFADAKSAVEKLEALVPQLKDAVSSSDKEKTDEQLGNIMFVLTNIARLSEIDAEESLTFASNRFSGVFAETEKRLLAEGKELGSMTIDELCSYMNV